jgi:nucleotide-binding universal stress UspA family protein
MSHVRTSRPFAAPTADAPAPALRGPILLACDGRARTDATAVLAHRIAGRLGARLEVLAVLEPLPIHAYGAEVPIIPPDFEDERRAELQALVRGRLEPVLGARDRWPLELRRGAPGRTIAEYARERRAGLVVVGTGGHGALERLLNDEVSLQTVRDASTPVLAVAADAAGPIHRAVVGVDFSAASIVAARTALALLEPGGADPARLTLVHVRAPVEAATPLLADWSRGFEARVSTMLTRVVHLLQAHAPEGVAIETRTRTGHVVDVVRETAHDVGAQLIAVGTHGPGWMERLFVGSVATRTLRQARTTVLVAPTPSPQERVRLELYVAGQVTVDRPADWPGALDTFTRRNAGRRARLEVGAPERRGFVVEAERYRFHGATYDPHDRRLTIMLGDDAAPGGPRAHLTHAVDDVRAIEIVATDERRDHTLLIEGARGHTVLTFVD